MVRKSPLFYYTIFYIVGIYLGNYLNCNLQSFVAIIVILLLITIALFYLALKNRSYKVALTLKYSLYFTFLQGGIINMGLSPYAQKNLVSSLSQKREIQNLRLFILNQTKVHRNSSSIECNAIDYRENVILYSKSKAIFEQMKPGDTIILDYIPISISNFNNDFDYEKFQAKKRYFTYSILNDTNFKLIKPAKRDFFSNVKIKRGKLIKEIRSKYGNSEWCNILIALVSGEKSYLEERTKEIYKASGAVHLMAVSGLHVGFVYLFVLNVLAVFGKKRVIRYFKTILTIIAIWAYCAFSGFSPSSVRASLMISILIVSELITGRYISLNALCASALIITVLQPQSLFDIGFQLSYIALLSILVLNPCFNRQRISENRVIQYCWNIITISISCQIGTSFITISSFGYFPLYFMIANIILMPLTAIVLYSFGAISILGFSDIAVKILSQIIKAVIDIMYKTAVKIESLPFAVIDTNLNKSKMIFSYIIVTVITVALLYSSRKKGLQSRGYE